MTEIKKKVLITGANRGIGFETAKQLRDLGCEVFLTARNEDSGREAAAEIGAEFILMDVSDENSIEAAAKTFGEHSDRLDVLINNAGIFNDRDVSILEVDQEKMFQTLLTNTWGPVLVARAFKPFLENANPGPGRIINLSSKLGQLSEMEDTAPAYGLSKTALNAVTRQLSAALKNKNIIVNSVSPGWVRTDMGGPDATSSLEEGADTVVWLAIEAPSDLTGQFLRDRELIAW